MKIAYLSTVSFLTLSSSDIKAKISERVDTADINLKVHCGVVYVLYFRKKAGLEHLFNTWPVLAMSSSVMHQISWFSHAQVWRITKPGTHSHTSESFVSPGKKNK